MFLNKKISEEFPVEVARRIGNKILNWKEALMEEGYIASLDMLFEFVLFWELRDGAWILEGKPGTGKTSFVTAVSRAMGVKPHRLDCFPSISRNETLYEWNAFLQDITAKQTEHTLRQQGIAVTSRAIAEAIYTEEHLYLRPLSAVIKDPSHDAICLINELDKVPLRSEFHSVILQVIDEFEITVPEMQTVMSRGDLPRPHIFITSNAGDKDSAKSGGEEELPQTILRRGARYKIEEHTMATKFKILLNKAPNLPRHIIVDAIYYLESIKNQTLEKEISISEVIKWIQRIEYLHVAELNAEVVSATMRSLTKTDYDTSTLKDNLITTFGQVIPRLKTNIDVEGELVREEKVEAELLERIREVAQDKI